jgi:hypothetical protein
MKLIYLSLITALLLASCKTIKVLKKMNAEEANFETWKNSEDKTVIFLPMVHAGKTEFYENVKRIIAEQKQLGYVVFYEGLKKNGGSEISLDPETRHRYSMFAAMHSYDSTSIDNLVYLLKFKRMVGIIPDSTTYAAMLKNNSLTKHAVFQPRPNAMGISGSDQNIDVSLVELVNEYEKKFGTITLEQIEFAIPLKDPLPRFRRLKRSQANELILDHRNKKLSDSIMESPHHKIIVIYGMGHKEGTFRQLKQADPSWKVIS